MRIAFDLRRIGNPGIGRYMSCLVETILKIDGENDYLLLLPPDWKGDLGSSQANVRRLIPRSGYYSLAEQFEIPRILREQGVDLLHSPHFLLPISRPCPAVVTIHDVIYLACPQDLPSPLGRLYYRAMMQTSARLATRIITDSLFSKNEIVRYLGVKDSKIEVIYPAVDSRFKSVLGNETADKVRAEYGIVGDYILYTGIYKPRKNHAGLLRAFRRFRSLGGQADLVITGPMNDGEACLRQLAQELGLTQHVVFTGFTPDSELCALYSGARAYACASLYEGFGFTVLEAMACGAPVVCSDAASLPEVAGNAALYIDATDPEAFGEALYRVCSSSDLRLEMIDRGYRNLQRFSWEEAATRTLTTYSDSVDNKMGETVAA